MLFGLPVVPPDGCCVSFGRGGETDDEQSKEGAEGAGTSHSGVPFRVKDVYVCCESCVWICFLLFTSCKVSFCSQLNEYSMDIVAYRCTSTMGGSKYFIVLLTNIYLVRSVLLLPT